MSRIVVVLALLTLLALPATPAGAAEAILDRPGFTCGGGSATIRFSWRPASGASVQYIDVSLAGDGFAPGTFTSAGPFDAGVSSYTWPAMRANVRHYYRVNALTPAGWQSTADTFTAPCHPAEASTGGRDAPFSLYAGVYVLDLGSGAVKRLADMRSEAESFPNHHSFDWSPDGSRLAVSLPSITSGLRVYDSTGALKSEVAEQAFNVKWPAGDTLVAHMRRGGWSGEEGYATVNAATGAIESFRPDNSGGTFSPDGRRVAYFYGEWRQPKERGLYIRDLVRGDERLLMAGEYSPIAWSPDGSRLAAGVSDGERSRLAILDASTGAELMRFDRGGLDVAWSPDGRSIAMAAYGGGAAETLEIVVLQADGTSRGLARGQRLAWSPDGMSLTYIRDGALWLATLSDGVESPLLRPQLPVVQEQRWSPAGNMIAFRTAGSGNGIYVMRSDGSDERYLTPGYAPQWSPKGDRLGFSFGGVYTMTPRGTAINSIGSVLSGDAVFMCQNGERYDWSPDGASIVYWTTQTGSSSTQRRVMNVVPDAPGAKATLLADGTAPAWSPDGQRIAFSTPAQPAAPGPAFCDVSTVAPDGSGTRVISSNARSPKWSPDGAWLAVETSPFYNSSSSARVRVIAADGSGQRGEFQGWGPVWSPDSKQIVYSKSSWTAGSIAPPHTASQIVVSSLDGSGARVIAEGDSSQFDWSPDGTRIVYSQYRGEKSTLYSFDVATGVARDIGTGRAPVFSPDGAWIAFVR